MDLLNQIKSNLKLFVPSLNVVDTWLWLANPKGTYTVHSAYACLQESDFDIGKDPFKSPWCVPAPSNVVAFTWKVFHDKIQTRDNLKTREVISSQVDARCPLCASHEESYSHLHFSCPTAWIVWMACYKQGRPKGKAIQASALGLQFFFTK